MFMQAGFAMVETGFTQAKNAGHTMAMNFMVYALGMLGYWICGFALQMGGVGSGTLGSTLGLLDSEFTIHLFGKTFGLFGMKGFFLSGVTYDAAIFTLFLFQMVFMDTTATIPDRFHGGALDIQVLRGLLVLYRRNQCIRSMRTGYGAAGGFQRSARTSAWVTGRLTSPAPRLYI